MNWSDPPQPDEELLVEAYIDGELNVAEKRAFEARMADDPELASEVRFARAVRSALRSTPSEMAPPSMTATVLTVARREARKDLLSRMRSWFLLSPGVSWQPALAMGVLLLMVGIAVRFGQPAKTPIEPEVAEALEQVKWTLAFLSDVSAETAETVRGSVLELHVVGPMQGAVEHVFPGPGNTN